MSQPPLPTLFICYSHTDQRYREQFSKFLKTPRLDRLNIFSDEAIEPGEDWQKIILGQLEQATAALILVSQDFMISPFIQQVELRELLARRIRNGLQLFLVPVRATHYQGTYLERFQWARSPDKPLSLLTPELQEEAMVAICLTIANRLADNPEPDAASAEHTIDCLKSVPKLDLPSVYEIEEPIGEGEYARCFMARDQLMGKPVIIKVLNTPLSQDSPGYDKYVRTASMLTHRNILSLLFSQANKLPHFIVTPAVGDETLEKRLRRGPVKISEAVDWTLSLASALAYAHGKDCVHGRLVPCEVRFDSENEVVLSGFRTLAALRDSPHRRSERLTLEEFVSSSPEQRDRCAVMTPRSDQYQLGLLAYEMIAGAPPVRAAACTWSSLLDAETARALLQPRPLGEVAPGCDERISKVVMRMLAVDPAARWDSLEDVIQALREWRATVPWIEEAKASYRRCAQDDRFYETLYDKLFESTPEIRAMFAGRSMAQQYQVLRDALWLLLSFSRAGEHDEPTILSGIARTHARFEPRQFELFGVAVLEAVAQHDPAGAAAVAAWRDAIKPGLTYLMSRAGKSSAAGV